MVLVNALYLEPRATKVMFERMRMRMKEEERGRETFASEPSRVADRQHAAATTTTPEAPSPTAATSAEQESVRSCMSVVSERLRRLNTNSSILS
ncbi:hypothetical protein SLEP1_g20664 [Rubroshorea leprosula]|uniref:Uncharacterized protein n=1 Tax=Rubroshorea leprosula TaxID=152421 RepID=A0AAV5JCF8_9ROSI|nr:hypothetical protein SLEP1_g20664 [Rubroshorea leprosula]